MIEAPDNTLNNKDFPINIVYVWIRGRSVTSISIAISDLDEFRFYKIRHHCIDICPLDNPGDIRYVEEDIYMNYLSVPFQYHFQTFINSVYQTRLY